MNEKFVSWFQEYIELQKALLSSIKPEQLSEIIETIKVTIKHKGKIYICGNGGSLSNSQHFICDMVKGVSDKLDVRVMGLALGSNPSLASAIANDYSYEDIFIKEIELANTPGETSVIIGISVSGNSPNVVKVMEYAKEQDMSSIAIVGNNGDNKIGRLAEYTIGLDSKHFGRVEDITMTLLHMVAYWFMEHPEEFDNV